MRHKFSLTPGVIIKSPFTGREDFIQQKAIMMKVKELPALIRDNIIKQHLSRKRHGAIAKTLNINGRNNWLDTMQVKHSLNHN